jgi:hypothetical protein
MGIMRIRTVARRALRLPLVFALAITFVPFDVAPAEAKRIKIRIHSGSGSSSDSNYAQTQDEHLKARPKSTTAAAAAAARARAALASEKGAPGAKGGTGAIAYQPVPVGKTTSYSNGVTCIAGC